MESYERKNAREWQLDNNGQPLQDSEDSEGSENAEALNKIQGRTERSVFDEASRSSRAKHMISGPDDTTPFGGSMHRNRDLTSTFLIDRDSDAKASWRRGQRWTGFHDLSTTYDRMDRSNAQSPQGVAVAKLFAQLEEIGVKTGAFVQPPKSYSDRRLHIWGSNSQVTAAKKELMRWTNNPRFTKVCMDSEKKQKMLRKQMEVEAEKQKYRQSPEDSAIFSVHGFFAWPPNHIHPTELFGQSVEAFDPVRMAYHCHMTFDTERSLFKVLSNNPKAVQGALQRIRTTVSELLSRSKKPMRLYLLLPPSLGGIRSEVGLKNSRAAISKTRVKPLLVGQPLTGEELQEWAQLRPKLSAANESCIQRAIIECLSRVRFYRGLVRMRVHFGSFVFSVYKKPKGPTHTFEEFMHMMRSSTTAGELIKDLEAGAGGTDLISRCQKATELFAPFDIITSSLEDVQPVYSAMFEVKNPAAEGWFRLEIDFNKVPETLDFEKGRKRWARLDGSNVDSGGMASSPPLDLNVVALEGSSSWQIQITADNSVDEAKLGPEIRKFAEGISFNADPAGTSPVTQDHQLVRFPTNLPVRMFVQKTAFRYRLKNSSYLFEIAKYQQSTPSGSGSVCRSSDGVARTTIWGASFFNEDWDMILSQNAHLGIGEAGTWKPSLATFFPRKIHTSTPGPDAGFRNFLTEVGNVATLLDSQSR